MTMWQLKLCLFWEKTKITPRNLLTGHDLQWCFFSPSVNNNLGDNWERLHRAHWEGLQTRVNEVELLQVRADPHECVVGDVSDGGVYHDDLGDVVGSEHVPEEPLYVAVGDGQVGYLHLGSCPQPHRHACCNKMHLNNISQLLWSTFNLGKPILWNVEIHGSNSMRISIFKSSHCKKE